jgi:hypothetical protein
MKKMILMILPLALVACGGITMIDKNQQDVIESKLPEIHEDGGQLCICRASNFAGSAAILGIKVNGEYIGDLPNNSYLCANLSPDEYSVTGDCTLCTRVGTETIIKQGQRKYMELSVNSVSLHSTSRDIGLSCIAGTM